MTVQHTLNDTARQLGSAVEALGYIAGRHPVVVGTVASLGAAALMRRRRADGQVGPWNGRPHDAATLLAVIGRLADASASAAEHAGTSTRHLGERAIAAVEGIDVGEVAHRIRAGGQAVQEELALLARREPLWFGLAALAVGGLAGAVLRRVI